MSGPELSATREVAPRRLSPLTPVVRAPIVLLAFLGASWQQLLEQRRLGLVGLLLLGLLVAGAVYGLASWLRTKYWIDGDELRIDKGVLFRQSRRIRIDRLQGVDIVQPLLARVFALAELRFDVASGTDREGALAFLPHTEAIQLRSLLLERRNHLRSDEGVAPAAATLEPAAPPVEVLARLDLGVLLASLALSSETLVLGGTALSLGTVFVLTGSFALAGGLLPTLVALVVALGRKLSAYYGFTLERSAAGLHVRRGLTRLSSQTVALARIQGVVVSEPLLWRPFGWAKLEVSVAGYRSGDADTANASSTLMPAAPKGEVLELVRQVLGDRVASAVPTTRPPRRAGWLAPLTWRRTGLGQDPQLLVSRRGWWVRRLDVVPQERVQSVRLTQGPLQRRLRLAGVRVDSPPGPVQVRGDQRDPDEARAFCELAAQLSRSARRREQLGQPTRAATPPVPHTTQ